MKIEQEQKKFLSDDLEKEIVRLCVLSWFAKILINDDETPVKDWKVEKK